MPSFDSVAALESACDLCPEVPFIFVSARLGEELAIDLLKRGATDSLKFYSATNNSRDRAQRLC